MITISTPDEAKADLAVSIARSYLPPRIGWRVYCLGKLYAEGGPDAVGDDHAAVPPAD